MRTAAEAADGPRGAHGVSPAWRDAVRAAPPLDLPARRTVVVVPHPDDEALACGALIALQALRCVDLVVVAVTDGEASHPGADRTAMADRRRSEQAASLRALGVPSSSVVRAGLPDGEVAEHRHVLAALLRTVLRPGDVLVAPWTGDHHCDHVAAGEAAAALAQEVPVLLLGSLFWAYHREQPDDRATYARLDLDATLVGRRREAADAHRSQRIGAEAVVPDELVEHLEEPWELYVVHADG